MCYEAEFFVDVGTCAAGKVLNGVGHVVVAGVEGCFRGIAADEAVEVEVRRHVEVA